MAILREPHFLSDEDRQRAYAACGKVAIAWGPIEMFLEQMLAMTRARQREQHLEFPMSFSRKVRDLKERLGREREHFQTMITGFLPLLTKAKSLHEFRGRIVHCYFQGQLGDGRLMFGRSDLKRGVGYTDRDGLFLIEEIETKAREMRELHSEMREFWTPFNGIVFKNIPKISRAAPRP